MQFDVKKRNQRFFFHISDTKTLRPVRITFFLLMPPNFEFLKVSF